MNLVKFECPACGQHMECERACGGDVIHCPRCCAEIRIPFRSPVDMEGLVSRAELVTPAPSGKTAHSESQPAQTNQPRDASAQISCPACHAELKVVIPAHGGPNTTLLRTPPSPPTPKPAEAEPAHPDFAHMSIEERERQIAAAREAHPIQLYPSMKPRLEYVLEGKAPPAAGKKPDPQQKRDPEQSQDSTTVTE
jgi:hypothetical protein